MLDGIQDSRAKQDQSTQAMYQATESQSMTYRELLTKYVCNKVHRLLNDTCLFTPTVFTKKGDAEIVWPYNTKDISTAMMQMWYLSVYFEPKE